VDVCMCATVHLCCYFSSWTQELFSLTVYKSELVWSLWYKHNKFL